MKIYSCFVGSPQCGGVGGFDVKDLTNLFIFHIISVNEDKHHLFLETLCNGLNHVEVCLGGPLVGKENEMLVPIVAKDCLPVILFELHDMRSGMESHKLCQLFHCQLILVNLLQPCINVDQQLTKRIFLITWPSKCFALIQTVSLTAQACR